MSQTSRSVDTCQPDVKLCLRGLRDGQADVGNKAAVPGKESVYFAKEVSRLEVEMIAFACC